MYHSCGKVFWLLSRELTLFSKMVLEPTEWMQAPRFRVSWHCTWRRKKHNVVWEELFPFTLPKNVNWETAGMIGYQPCVPFEFFNCWHHNIPSSRSRMNLCATFSVCLQSEMFQIDGWPRFFIARTQACASNKCDNTACRTWLNLQEHISLLQRSCHTTWLWSSVSPSSAESCIWCAAQAWAHLEL